MSTTKRSQRTGVIQRLFDEPYRFDFFQAVWTLERWLIQHGVAREDVLAGRLHFQNSISMNFSAAHIEAIQVDAFAVTESQPEFEAALLRTLQDGDLKRIVIRPSFIGLLGCYGVLPAHYSDRVAAQLHADKEEGVRAFLDIYSSRLVALYYQSWAKCRLELAGEDEQERLHPLLMALSGADGPRQDAALPGKAAAFYAAPFGQRPCSAATIQSVLQEYFCVPVAVEAHRGYWHPLEPGLQMQLDGDNACLGERCILGPDTWRRDLRARVVLGPLPKAQYDHFSPGEDGALVLARMLSMFSVVALQFEICLILRASDVPQMRLGGDAENGGFQLGVDTFLEDGTAQHDRDELRYFIDAF
ncbi:type VI secretion system baseplate subunit TssG [Oxalobacteraceae bacterium]|nr:type VI secretion system baseplate subunit TssG [Oxalobacteraceae bacterium]